VPAIVGEEHALAADEEGSAIPFGDEPAPPDFRFLLADTR
jgi:hypothetical protein